MPWSRVPNPQPENIPEPSTVLAWTFLAGAAAFRLRRSARAS
jgi:hypothetical protein